MLLNRFVVIGILFFLPSISYNQVLDYIDIHLKIVEKVANQNKPLANSQLKISDYGEVSTDAEGRYTFPYAIRQNVDPNISISLFSPEHKMLKPLDGLIELDTTREEIFIDLFVVNMAEESEAFKKRIGNLESRVARLKSKNELTQRQLNAINNQLLDTIMHFEKLKQNLENEIEEYENLTEAQQKEIDSKNAQIEDLERQVNQLTIDLETALEERYLRKNQYFKDISGNLLGYIRKAKDLRDHLPYIKTYFTVRSFANYERDILAYNEQYELFDNNQLDYLEGVKHYWGNRALTKKLEDLFSYMSKGIHYNQIYRRLKNLG